MKSVAGKGLHQLSRRDRPDDRRDGAARQARGTVLTHLALAAAGCCPSGDGGPIAGTREPDRSVTDDACKTPALPRPMIASTGLRPRAAGRMTAHHPWSGGHRRDVRCPIWPSSHPQWHADPLTSPPRPARCATYRGLVRALQSAIRQASCGWTRWRTGWRRRGVCVDVSSVDEMNLPSRREFHRNDWSCTAPTTVRFSGRQRRSRPLRRGLGTADRRAGSQRCTPSPAGGRDAQSADVLAAEIMARPRLT